MFHMKHEPSAEPGATHVSHETRSASETVCAEPSSDRQAMKRSPPTRAHRIRTGPVSRAQHPPHRSVLDEGPNIARDSSMSPAMFHVKPRTAASPGCQLPSRLTAERLE